MLSLEDVGLEVVGLPVVGSEVVGSDTVEIVLVRWKICWLGGSWLGGGQFEGCFVWWRMFPLLTKAVWRVVQWHGCNKAAVPWLISSGLCRLR